MDSAPKLFEAEPSGAFTGMKATVIGAGKAEVTEFLEKEYSDTMSIDQLISLGFKAMKQVPDMKIKSDIFDVGVIPVATKKFELLPLEKVNSYVTKI